MVIKLPNYLLVMVGMSFISWTDKGFYYLNFTTQLIIFIFWYTSSRKCVVLAGTVRGKVLIFYVIVLE